MITGILAFAFVLAGQSATPAVAIKIAPENDHVNPLPLDADVAARRFGKLSPAESAAVLSAARQLFAKLRNNPGGDWNGPTLFLSHSAELDYREANLSQVKTVLKDGSVTLFDPYSLGKRGGETDAVIMAKASSDGAAEEWTAVAFVLKGDVVQRIVVAPQPWIVLLNR